MLRCGSAHALRTGVGNALAARRSIQDGGVRLATTRLLPPITRRAVAGQTWRLSGTKTQRKTFVTESKRWDISDLGPEDTAEAEESEASPDAILGEVLNRIGDKGESKEKPGARPMKARLEEEDPLYAIVKSAPQYKALKPDQSYAESLISQKALEMELKWLEDPRALADRVGRLLRNENFTMALAMVRSAQSQGKECQVAWNHVLEHCMKKGSSRSAFRLFNEMKKRGRKPSATTITILLKGFSKQGKHTGIDPVKSALSIYKSLFAENSFVKPNLIHSNAMLTVCSLHGDMDTLWQIAGELPEDGPGSPDPFTYTIILRAIMESTQADVHKLYVKKKKGIMAREAKGVKEGKLIWSDIIHRWKNGQNVMDNQLVSTMAALLLRGPSEHNTYEVFQLYNQTMGIPIFPREPPLLTNNKTGAYPSRFPNKLRGKDAEDHVPFVDEDEKLYKPSEPDTEGSEEDPPLDNVFDPVISEDVSSATGQGVGPSHLTVGNRDLSVILDACMIMTQALGAGKEYWNYFTRQGSPHNVEPDPGAMAQYLRLLRIARSSRTTVEILRDQMVPAGIANKVAFHIAMSCCSRDRKNLNVVKHANELLDLMKEHLIMADVKALDGYLDLIEVLLGNPMSLMSLHGLDESKTLAKGTGLQTRGRALRLKLQLVAIDHLRPHFTRMDQAMQKAEYLFLVMPSKKPRPDDFSGATAVKVLTRVRALIDDILKPENASSLPKSIRKELEIESKDLSAYSRPVVFEKYNGKFVSPTADQKLEFRDRQNAKWKAQRESEPKAEPANSQEEDENLQRV